MGRLLTAGLSETDAAFPAPDAPLLSVVSLLEGSIPFRFRASSMPLIRVSAAGDDQHHLAEDVALCLGKALAEALGEKRGIIRMGDAAVPMDDALATVAVDISGRGYTVLELPFNDNDMAGFSTDLIRHFLESFALEARLNLHARVVYGTNDHHKAEALFKALGRALDMATRIDERLGGELPSTKEFLDG